MDYHFRGRVLRHLKSEEMRWKLDATLGDPQRNSITSVFALRQPNVHNEQGAVGPSVRTSRELLRLYVFPELVSS